MPRKKAPTAAQATTGAAVAPKGHVMVSEPIQGANAVVEPALGVSDKPAKDWPSTVPQGLERQLATLANKVDLLLVALTIVAPQAVGAAIRAPIAPVALNGSAEHAEAAA